MDINELYIKARDGDNATQQKLFAQLSARFRLLAFRKVRDRQEAEDVVQEAMAVIAREFATIEITLSFAAWAWRVLDNRILAWRQAQKRSNDRMVDLPEFDQLVAAPDSELSELRGRLLSCLKKARDVNPRYARVLAMKYQGLMTDEICQRIKLTPATLYSLLSRARTMLMKCLETGEIK